MKKLLELAKKIKDRELRKKVEDLLKDPRLSSRDFKKYKPEKIEKAGSIFVVPSSAFGPVERKLVEHTVVLTELCEKAVEIFKENYGLELNKDHLIAAAIVHDIGKIFEFKRNVKGELEPTGLPLDHTMLGTAELYARDFPEEVIHIVASHYGESGPTPPRSFEAIVLHYLDSLISLIEYFHEGRKMFNKQLIFLSEEDLKRLGGETETSK